MAIQIEIEIRTPLSNEVLQELRDYLRDNCTGLEDVHLKVKPPLPSQMEINAFESIMTASIEVAISLFIHHVWEGAIWPAVQKGYSNIIKKNASANSLPQPLELGVSVKDGTSALYFNENNDGTRQLFNNINYAIDLDNTYAVLIGCGDYNKNFPDIPPAKGNIEDMTLLLTDKRCMGLQPQNIFTLFNGTSDKIQSLLYKTSRIQGIQTLIIYYVGHGYQAGAKKLFLTATNTEKIDDITIFGGIDYNFIKNDILQQSQAKQKIVLLDACHSGLAAQSAYYSSYDIDVEGTYVLASSAGDEPSYFLPEDRNTLFTGAMIQLLKNGVESTQEMVSLKDLYEKSKEILVEKSYPSPIPKNNLNISPEKFFISLNPAFSYEKLKEVPKKLFEQGRIKDALAELESLIDRYPDDDELLKVQAGYNKVFRYNQLVQEANTFFYKQEDYFAAADKYTQALKLNNTEAALKDNLRICQEKIAEARSHAIQPVKPALDSAEEKEVEDKITGVTLGSEENKTINIKNEGDFHKENKEETRANWRSLFKSGPVRVVALIVAAGITAFVVFRLWRHYSHKGYSTYIPVEQTGSNIADKKAQPPVVITKDSVSDPFKKTNITKDSVSDPFKKTNTVTPATPHPVKPEPKNKIYSYSDSIFSIDKPAVTVQTIEGYYVLKKTGVDYFSVIRFSKNGIVAGSNVKNFYQDLPLKSLKINYTDRGVYTREGKNVKLSLTNQNGSIYFTGHMQNNGILFYTLNNANGHRDTVFYRYMSKL